MQSQGYPIVSPVTNYRAFRSGSLDLFNNSKVRKVIKVHSFSVAFFIIIFSPAVCGQKNNQASVFFGKESFGRGDVAGWFVSVEMATKLKKQDKSHWRHFQIGADLSFETGVKNPKIRNPTDAEFIATTFYHISNMVLSGSIVYYPLNNTFLKGLSFSLGPSFGYSFVSTEFQRSLITTSTGEKIRSTYLEFDNGLLIGYKVGICYQYVFKKSALVGLKVNFSNYQNGDINTLAGIKAGWVF